MEINEVKELLNQFNDSNLTEFDLREGSFELYMNKNQTSRQTAAPVQTEQVTEVAPVVSNTPAASNLEAESTPVAESKGTGQVITSLSLGSFIYSRRQNKKPINQWGYCKTRKQSASLKR